MSDGPLVPRAIETRFEGRVFTVAVETIGLPHGGELRAEIVRHPGSVVMIPVTAAGEIVLVRQYRHAIGRHAWELPAGSLKPREDVTRAAARECQEEIGMIPARLDPLGTFYPTPGYCDEAMHVFLATGLREPGPDDEAAHQDEDEDIETRTFSREALWKMVAAGEIVDLKTVAGLALITRGLEPGAWSP